MRTALCITLSVAFFSAAVLAQVVTADKVPAPVKQALQNKFGCGSFRTGDLSHQMSCDFESKALFLDLRIVPESSQ